MAAERLKELHTALVNTRAVYELALKGTDDEEVGRICKEMISLRHTDHRELHQSLISAGEVPDENGSFISVVHETVVGVRAALTGISKKTLPAFVSGEENIVEEYNDALRQASGDPNVTQILTSGSKPAALIMDETPALQPTQPAYDSRARHSHVSCNLCDGKWFFLKLPKSYA